MLQYQILQYVYVFRDSVIIIVNQAQLENKYLSAVFHLIVTLFFPNAAAALFEMKCNALTSSVNLSH